MQHDPLSYGEIEFCEEGRALGHDLYRHSLLALNALWPPPVREGFQHAAAQGVARTRGDYFERKWLQLRLGAHARRRFVDPRVTPSFLELISVEECPILRAPLSRAERSHSDASVDRLNNDGAYAPGNLAVMSTRVNLAKRDLTFVEVCARADSEVPTDGLEPAQWQRLSALMLGPCFADRPALVPTLPMTVPIPNGTVRFAIEQVQFAFAQRAARPAGKNALIKHFRAACPDERAQLRLRQLAEAAHEGLKGLAYPWDVWLDRQAFAALQAWHASCGGRWNRVGDLAIQLLGGGAVDQAWLRQWRLAQRGYHER